MKDSPVTDNNDLASFGYRQELKRSIGSFSSFAAGFSYISILTGLFQMFYLGYGLPGPDFSGPGHLYWRVNCWWRSALQNWLPGFRCLAGFINGQSLLETLSLDG
jgi:hypothetical protein